MKKITWENCKNDLANLWPNYVSVGELGKLGYDNQERVTMLLELLLEAGEIETQNSRSKKDDTTYRINYGSSEELLIETLDMLKNVMSCVSKRHVLNPFVTEPRELLIKLNRATEATFDPTFVKVSRGKAEPLGSAFGSRVYEVLNSCLIVKKNGNDINRLTVLEDTLQRNVGIPEERVAKIISTLVSQKQLTRINDTSPACYKITGLGMSEHKKQTAKLKATEKKGKEG